MQGFVFVLVKSISIQILGVFGIFFLFGFILAKLQHQTHRNYRRSVGWKGILWTAWIGTPVHEIGHVFFAKLFRHKVIRVTLFKPNRATGGLGHVEHSYSKRSIFQRIGNFFIGAAPMIFGSIILVTLLYFLVPNGKEIFSLFQADYSSITSLLEIIKETALQLFSTSNIRDWKFWIFLYVSFCIASHIAPSKQDQKGMWRGFAWILLLLLIANTIALLFGKDITEIILSANQVLAIFSSIFLYAIIISFIHLIFSSALALTFRK